MGLNHFTQKNRNKGMQPNSERDPHGDLRRLVRTFKATLDEWTKSVSELATWIRVLAATTRSDADRTLVRRSVRGRQ